MKPRLNHGIDAGHMIGEVVFGGILVLQKKGEILAVPDAAPVVVVKDDITFCRIALQFSREIGSVRRMGPAVNFEDQRIFFGSIETRRRDVPGLDLSPIPGRTCR